MENTQHLAELIAEYGDTIYGSEEPEYVASQWAEALPEADLPTFRQWLSHGFWSPEVSGALSKAGISPQEIPADMVYDLCNNDLDIAHFSRVRKY